MPLATIQLPPINWTGDAGTKRVLLLEDLLPGFVLPPSPWLIKSFGLLDQPLAEYPAGSSGRIAGGVDPGRRYIKASSFPIAETCDGQALKRCGYLEFRPGSNKVRDEMRPDGIVYRPGTDAFLMVAECSGFGSRGFSVFASIGIECDDFELETGTVFSSALDHEVTGSGPICFRTLVPNTLAGTQVRFRTSTRFYGCNMKRSSVGVQATGSSTTGAPVAVTWGSAAGPNLGPWSRMWSDWADLPQSGAPLLFNASMCEAANSFSYRGLPTPTEATGPSDSWWSATDAYASAAMVSPTLMTKCQRVIDAVQVR